MRRLSFATVGAISVAAVMIVSLATPRPAEAFIHEIIAALCRAGGEEVIPPGQVRPGDAKSFVRALLATGFIASVDTSDPTQVVINFDPTVPNSKFKSAGFDLTIPDGIAPGVDLVLSPLVVPDENFPAHANCRNLNP
jgi:hypothetical protein